MLTTTEVVPPTIGDVFFGRSKGNHPIVVSTPGQLDPITRLPLGAAVRNRVSGNIGTTDGVSLAIIGVDHLHRLNQSHGYHRGDAVLRVIAGRIGASVRNDDFVGRLGGARFAVVLRGTTEERSREIAGDILHAVHGRPIEIDTHKIHVEASIGIASEVHLRTAPADNQWTDPEQLIALADAALTSARSQSGSRVEVANIKDPHQLRHLRESTVVALLEGALENEGFHLWSQRMESLGNRWTETTKPSEILLRLSDANLAIGPDIFIPIAERFGLIHQIDLWVLRNLLAEASVRNRPAMRWARTTGNPQWFINVSPQSCETEGFAGHCEALIRSSRVPPELLCFELTETAAVQRLDAVQAFVDRLHSLGCWVALDDFGSGQSSLGHLGKLDIDFLKIDGSLVRDVDTDRRARALIAAIDSVAVAYGIRTIAEHVETQREARVLSELGIDLGQGWLYERPHALPPRSLASTTA